MIWRMVKAFVAGLILAMGMMMAVFALSAVQTIDWCVENQLEIPWQSFALLLLSALWAAIVVAVPKQWYDDLKRALTNLTKE